MHPFAPASLPGKRVVWSIKNLWVSQLSEFPIGSQLSGAPNWCSVEAWCPVPFVFLLEPKGKLSKKLAKWKSFGCSSFMNKNTFRFYVLDIQTEVNPIQLLRVGWLESWRSKKRCNSDFSTKTSIVGIPILSPRTGSKNLKTNSSINFTSPTNHQPFPWPKMSTSLLHDWLETAKTNGLPRVHKLQWFQQLVDDIPQQQPRFFILSFFDIG